jgi:FAD/FMN-containing dehydrogenase
MKNILDQLRAKIKGEIKVDEETLKKYSRDTSLFEIKPTAVVFPESALEVSEIVKFVGDNKNDYPGLSITARSGGTDISGGAIGEGLILDFTRHLSSFSVDVDEKLAKTGPGVFYRDFEKETLKNDLIMPVFPASKNIAALGGMVANNCGGEKSLRYGQIRNFVKGMKVVLSNGAEHDFRKIPLDELQNIVKRDSYVSEIYQRIYALIEKNYELIQMARPETTKNSSGYALWDVLDRENKTFDMTQLFTGAQGTLGIITEAEIKLLDVKKHKRLVTLFFDNWDSLPETVNKMLKYDPESMEVFDDTTLKLGIRFMPEIAKKVNKGFFQFASQFLPEFWIGVKMMGLPKLIMLMEFEEDEKETLDKKVDAIVKDLKRKGTIHRVIDSEDEAEKYYVVRRESFNLLREKVKGKQTAAFMEDFCVLPEKLPEFMPKLLKILKDNGMSVNIVGHAGSGNLHIFPLMDLSKESVRENITKVTPQVYDLIIRYGGTITAEHNDGIIRTPYVEKMFGTQMYNLFKEVKEIFDPHNIFNPGKKVGGTVEYANEHIKRG